MECVPGNNRSKLTDRNFSMHPIRSLRRRCILLQYFTPRLDCVAAGGVLLLFFKTLLLFMGTVLLAQTVRRRPVVIVAADVASLAAVGFELAVVAHCAYMDMLYHDHFSLRG